MNPNHALLLALALSAPAHGAGDAVRGARAFKQCMACHSINNDEHLTGPSLAHVWNRRAASTEGFQRYSDALKSSNLTWTDATLNKWLANPAQLVPGTSMTFPGIKDPSQRQDLIAYLQAASEGKAPQTEGGRMRMGGGPRLDLKTAPPEGQVTAVKYCGDTYTIDTADGKSQKIWEFNLRIKTDSTRLGPLPGKPVVIGAGMQGDRASLVFAKPSEISAIVKPCS